MSINDNMKIDELTIEKLKVVSGPTGDNVIKKNHAFTEKKSKLY
jgi:hypothetical protein